MAEHPSGDSGAPHHPPQSVASRDVRRLTLVTYLGPIVLLFVVVGVALIYWATRPTPAPTSPERDIPQAEGTAGNTTPGGFEPQPAPPAARSEIERRGGQKVTELGELLDERSRLDAGRPVEVEDVEVDAVESTTVFWVRDGNARAQVVAPAGAAIQAGAHVDIAGVAERHGETLRIRASKVTPSARDR